MVIARRSFCAGNVLKLWCTFQNHAFRKWADFFPDTPLEFQFLDDRFAALYDQEIDLALEEMARIRIEESGLMLDPRPAGNGIPGPR